MTTSWVQVNVTQRSIRYERRFTWIDGENRSAIQRRKMRAGYEWETAGTVLTTVGKYAPLSTAASFTFCPELTAASAHLSNADINRIKTGIAGGLYPRQHIPGRQHQRHPHGRQRNSVQQPVNQHPTRHRPSGAATSPSAPQLRVGLAELPLAAPTLPTWRVDYHQFQVLSSRPPRQQHANLLVEDGTIVTRNVASEASPGATCNCQLPNPQFCTLHLLRSAALIQPRRAKTWLPLSICSVYNSTTSAMPGGGATDSDRCVTISFYSTNKKGRFLTFLFFLRFR